MDPEYVMQLVNDVRWFAEVLLNLKDAFQYKGKYSMEGAGGWISWFKNMFKNFLLSTSALADVFLSDPAEKP